MPEFCGILKTGLTRRLEWALLNVSGLGASSEESGYLFLCSLDAIKCSSSSASLKQARVFW